MNALILTKPTSVLHIAGFKKSWFDFLCGIWCFLTDVLLIVNFWRAESGSHNMITSAGFQLCVCVCVCVC